MLWDSILNTCVNILRSNLLFHCYHSPGIRIYFGVHKIWFFWGGNPGLVVMGGDMFRRSWVRIPVPYTGWTWHFFTLICCKKIIVCLKRPKINKKRPGCAHFLNKIWFYPNKVSLNWSCSFLLSSQSEQLTSGSFAGNFERGILVVGSKVGVVVSGVGPSVLKGRVQVGLDQVAFVAVVGVGVVAAAEIEIIDLSNISDSYTLLILDAINSFYRLCDCGLPLARGRLHKHWWPHSSH